MHRLRLLRDEGSTGEAAAGENTLRHESLPLSNRLAVLAEWMQVCVQHVRLVVRPHGWRRRDGLFMTVRLLSLVSRLGRLLLFRQSPLGIFRAFALLRFRLWLALFLENHALAILLTVLAARLFLLVYLFECSRCRGFDELLFACLLGLRCGIVVKVQMARVLASLLAVAHMGRRVSRFPYMRLESHLHLRLASAILMVGVGAAVDRLRRRWRAHDRSLHDILSIMLAGHIYLARITRLLGLLLHVVRRQASRRLGLVHLGLLLLTLRDEVSKLVGRRALALSTLMTLIGHAILRL